MNPLSCGHLSAEAAADLSSLSPLKSGIGFWLREVGELRLWIDAPEELLHDRVVDLRKIEGDARDREDEEHRPEPEAESPVEAELEAVSLSSPCNQP